MTKPDGERFTRAEHLQWSKARAIEYVRLNNLQAAINSMTSDLSKHPQTNNQPLIRGTMRILLCQPLTAKTVIHWINGFN